MKVNSYKCDECGLQKQETNHWYVLLQPSQELLVMTWDEGVKRNYLHTEIPLHVCGQSCLHKAVDRWMTTGKLAA